MSNLHPKLNWEAFQKARARRKRRRLLWWFFWLPTTACVAALVVVQLSGPSKLASEKAAKVTTESLLEQKSATTSTHAEIALRTPENADPTRNLTEQPKRSGENPVTNPELNPSKPEKAVVAATNAGRSAQASIATQKEANQPGSTPSSSAASGKSMSKTSAAFSQKSAIATPALDTQEVAGPLEKMEILKLLSLMRRPLALPGTLTVLPTMEIPAPDRDFKKKKAPAKHPIWLSLSWSPWHSAEFLAPALDPITELNYRALNSVQALLRIHLASFPNGTVSIEPQFIEQRFQTQFNGQFSDKIYSPGSVVGYLQTVKGIEPIISDSVPGISGVGLRKNGVQREFSLPFTVDYSLFGRGYFRLSTAASLGLHYRARYQGLWYDDVQLVELKETPAMLGLLAAGNLSLNFQPGKIRYYCSWITTYRSTVRIDQPALRNQVWIGMSVPLKR